MSSDRSRSPQGRFEISTLPDLLVATLLVVIFIVSAKLKLLRRA
jgi:hypothetical protein